jgi:Insertion element 4 transposase N-terminal/Transposase DDE domain
MRRQGRCVLPTDGAGWVLDRLAGWQQVIPPGAVSQALWATGRRKERACTPTHEVMLGVALALGILTDLPIRQVFKHTRRLRPGEKTPHRASLCQARQRLGVAPVRHLFGQVVRPLATPRTPGAYDKGWRRVGIDGTAWDVPDSPANARVCGRPTGGRGEGAFPQVRKLSLVELGTHAEFALVLKPCRRGETTLAWGLLRHVQPGMLLLEDRNLFSYRWWQAVTRRGGYILARVKSHLVLPPLQVLPDGSYLTKIDRAERCRRKDEGGIVVRVLRYTLEDPQRTGHGEAHTPLTSLLDPTRYPALERIVLYHQRWEHEQTYDEQKTHQDPRRATKPAQVRSETPAGVVQEIDALSLGHYVARALMAEAAREEELDPGGLSFVGCLQILRCRLQECDSGSPQSLAAWYTGLLWELGRQRTEPRRNRINPRVVERTMSKFKKKRPEHRRLPPLKKGFIQTVVMRN